MQLHSKKKQISQVWCFGDMSDAIKETQHIKNITDLFRVSLSYLRRPVQVKPKPKEVSHILPLFAVTMAGLLGGEFPVIFERHDQLRV